MKKYKFNLIVHYSILVFCSLFIIIPVLWMLSTALKPTSEVISDQIKWIPEHISFNSFFRMWEDYPFLIYFKNSILMLIGTILVSVSVAAFAGYGLSRFEFKGKHSFLLFLLVTQMFPSIMLLVPFYQLLRTYHLVDTLSGITLVNISISIPFCSWLMYGYFKSIPKDLDESARIDGCGSLKTFFFYCSSAYLAGLGSTAIYTGLNAWTEYMFSVTLLTSEEVKTVSLGIALFNGYYKILWNDLMASSIIATFPLIILFIALQKSFISSLSAGSVK